MIKNNYLIYDFETGSTNPYKTQPIQLASIIVDGSRLTLVPNSDFESLIKPLSDEEAIALDLDTIQQSALDVNKKTREELEAAPDLKSVWERFVDYTKKYNIGKDEYDRPIPVGYNNTRFDDIIMNRLANQFGCSDERNNIKLFHPMHSVDVFKFIYMFYENTKVRRFGLDNMRTIFGMSKDGAHDALVDVYDTAELLVRFLRLTRKVYKDTLFEGSVQDRLIKKW